MQSFFSVSIDYTPENYTSSHFQSAFINFIYEDNSLSCYQVIGAGVGIKEIIRVIRNNDDISIYPVFSFIESITNLAKLYHLSDIQTPLPSAV